MYENCRNYHVVNVLVPKGLTKKSVDSRDSAGSRSFTSGISLLISSEQCKYMYGNPLGL